MGKESDYPLSIFDTYYIVDNFYKNPDGVRQLAISSEKEETTGGNYAGVMTHNAFLTQEHLDIIGYLVRAKVKPSTQFTGKFRFTKTGEVGTQDIHFDPGDNDCAWAGVCYLSPDVPDNTEGTVFWRHKQSGLEAIPRDEEGIKPFGDLKKFLDTDGVDYDKWDRVLTIPYKYNRLVLFRPWLFHSPGTPFGDTIDNCRLIQTFFLRYD